jgi:hypothetical protein
MAGIEGNAPALEMERVNSRRVKSPTKSREVFELFHHSPRFGR